MPTDSPELAMEEDNRITSSKEAEKRSDRQVLLENIERSGDLPKVATHYSADVAPLVPALKLSTKFSY